MVSPGYFSSTDNIEVLRNLTLSGENGSLQNLFFVLIPYKVRIQNNGDYSKTTLYLQR